jgi:hypothetical protein
LRLVHGYAERPSEGGDGAESILREDRAVHLWDNVVVEGGGHILKERCTVNIESGGIKSPVSRPLIGISFRRNNVDGLDWVVEVSKINLGIRGTHELVLSLSEENLMLIVGEEIALGCIKVHIRTEYLYVAGSKCAIPALHPDLNIMILETNQRKGFGPVVREEEGENVVVRGSGRTEGILGALIKGESARSLGLSILVQKVMNTLDVEGINLGNLLATNPKLEFSGSGIILVEETGISGTDATDVLSLNPHITQEITLGLDGNGNLITTSEGTDIIEPFWFDREVGIPLVILSKKRHLGLTSDIDVLGTHRHEVN